jgi:hypothetical protein
MRGGAVIVADERLKMPAQAGLVKHNKVIKAFATDGADHSFDIGALHRRARCRQYMFDPHRLQLLDEITAEDAVTIAQQEARRATVHFSDAITVLRERMSTSHKQKYDRSRHATEEARVKSEQARLALEEHVAVHRC